MAKGDLPPGVSGRLDQLLMSAKPEELTERQWCIRSKVSTSFFTDLRNGSDPSIDRVERMANTIGLRLSDLIEGVENVPVVGLPSADQLAGMIDLGLDAGVDEETPRARIAEIVAPVVREQLRLFRSAEAPGLSGKAPARGKGAQSRPPTKRSGKEGPRTP